LKRIIGLCHTVLKRVIGLYHTMLKLINWKKV